jgi:prepilin-type N-terminal cleavage/methylation domain-containing protein
MIRDKYLGNQRGFTYIELLLYMAIISILFSALIPYAWNVIGGGAKSSAEQEVYSQARLISERIKYEVRNSTDINVSSSSLGVDLALVPGSQLSVAKPNTSGNDPTIFSVVNGDLMIKQGSGQATQLNSDNIMIESLKFISYISGDLKTKNLQLLLSIKDDYQSSRQEYQVPVINIESSIELRSN